MHDLGFHKTEDDVYYASKTHKVVSREPYTEYKECDDGLAPPHPDRVSDSSMLIRRYVTKRQHVNSKAKS